MGERLVLVPGRFRAGYLGIDAMLGVLPMRGRSYFFPPCLLAIGMVSFDVEPVEKHEYLL